MDRLTHAHLRVAFATLAWMNSRNAYRKSVVQLEVTKLRYLASNVQLMHINQVIRDPYSQRSLEIFRRLRFHVNKTMERTMEYTV